MNAKIEDQESRDVLNTVVKSLSEGMKTSKEKVKKAEKIKVAKSLLKLGVSINIISRATDLTAEELETQIGIYSRNFI